MIKKFSSYFRLHEKILWCSSVTVISLFFFLFDGKEWLSFIASLTGVTFLIFNAKGNPVGQFLTIVFSIMYGIISYGFSYYGEMITYLGMTAPMALFALISWLRHPFQGNYAEVEVNSLTRTEIIFMFLLTAVITAVFYFILAYFNTVNMIPSTLSVTTSFLAVYLTFRRSRFFALAYASNDIVLIILWAFATIKDASYVSVLVCFIVFFINDMYGFINWSRMEKQQNESSASQVRRD